VLISLTSTGSRFDQCRKRNEISRRHGWPVWWPPLGEVGHLLVDHLKPDESATAHVLANLNPSIQRIKINIDFGEGPLISSSRIICYPRHRAWPQLR
jgi:hypothetical protein